MTSLAELKNIEQQRLADERAAVIRADELRKQAALDAERSAREDAERKLREEREAQLAIEQAKVAAERELRLRVEQAEAAERARQQLALEQERHQQELELRRAEVAKKRPKWMMAVTAMALACAAVLVVLTVKAVGASDDAEAARRKADAIAQQAAEDVEKMRLELVRLEGELKTLDGNLEVALDKVAVAQSVAEAKAAADEVRRINEAKYKARKLAEDIERERLRKIREGGVKEVCSSGSICRDMMKK